MDRFSPTYLYFFSVNRGYSISEGILPISPLGSWVKGIYIWLFDYMTNGDLEITLLFISQCSYPHSNIAYYIWIVISLFHKKSWKGQPMNLGTRSILGYDYLPYMTVASLEMSDEPKIWITVTFYHFIGSGKL